MQTLRQRIADHSAHVCIIGLSYVGLPLAVEFAKVGYRVTGLDTDRDRVAGINAGHCHVQDVSDTELQHVVTTHHSTYDYEWIVAQAQLIVDTRNATQHVKEGREKIHKL
jgi:UDP-N-acetyl-D-mannosaminuronate dehydrogenase